MEFSSAGDLGAPVNEITIQGRAKPVWAVFGAAFWNMR